MKTIEIDGLNVHLFVWNYIDANAYVMEENGFSLIIDPIDAKEFWEFLDERSIHTADVILTHEHFDHISGLNKLRQKINCTVYAHKKCSENIGIATRNLSSAANVLGQVSEKVQGKDILLEPFVCVPADVVFDETYVFCWKGHKVELVHTPGHSAGSICVVLDGEKLFSGDTLLADPTITKLPGGDKKALKEITMPWLEKKLAMVKWVLPGHGDVWENMELNQSFLALNNKEMAAGN